MAVGVDSNSLTQPCVEVQLAPTAAERDEAKRLKRQVYESEQGRQYAQADEWDDERFDPFSTYFLARLEGVTVGAVKLVADSALGLPCEVGGNLDGVREGRRLVEVGNFVVLPEFRRHAAGVLLMRQAIRFAADGLQASHALADFFIDDDSSRLAFYQAVGFLPVGRAYHDQRFVGAPLSMIGMLDIAETIARRRRA